MFALPIRNSILDPRFDDDLFSRPIADFFSPFLLEERDAQNIVNRPTKSIRSKQKAVNDPNKFNVNLNLSHFDPSEISVKFDEGKLLVNAKHEKTDGDHYEYREFVQKCLVPENVITEQLKSSLDKRGMLRIEAPVKQDPKQLKPNERDIPIEFVAANPQKEPAPASK